MSNEHSLTWMDPDYFRPHEAFVLYATDTIGWIFTLNREGLYAFYTRDMSSVGLPSCFWCYEGSVVVSTVAQIMAKYTDPEV